MLNALFGVAYGLETPFFPHLAAPNLAPKTISTRLSFLTIGVCSGLSLGQMRAQVSHSVVVEGLSLSQGVGASSNREHSRGSFR
jgi:hypothetical protein